MNYKLEKFWNGKTYLAREFESPMNYKLEKFWNFDDTKKRESLANEL